MVSDITLTPTPPRPGRFAVHATNNKPGGNGWAKGD